MRSFHSPRLLHGDDHDAVVLLGVVAQDGDEQVGVERVQTPRRLVQQQHHWGRGGGGLIRVEHIVLCWSQELR